ncbi:MAG TPA: hypothetical protein VMY41_11760 [Thermohalobaculum sp.]|nr:hypothetical protein [Thermohalobaculum sp.]
MHSEITKDTLIEEFQELGEEDVILQKEVYAHFGLLFFKLALVEHSLINFYVFNTVYEDYRRGILTNKLQWESPFDAAYEGPRQLTSAIFPIVSWAFASLKI